MITTSGFTRTLSVQWLGVAGLVLKAKFAVPRCRLLSLQQPEVKIATDVCYRHFEDLVFVCTLCGHDTRVAHRQSQTAFDVLTKVGVYWHRITKQIVREGVATKGSSGQRYDTQTVPAP
jgi:hypothetical protein